MSSLSELYITMESLCNLYFPTEEKLKQEAAKLKEDSIHSEIFPTLKEKFEPALVQVQNELLLVNYRPRQPHKVKLSCNRNIPDVLTDAVEFTYTKRRQNVTATDIKRGLFCRRFYVCH